MDPAAPTHDHDIAPASSKADSSAETAVAEISAEPRAYGYGAERRHQPKTTDLIPKRWRSYSLVVFLLMACVGLINLGAMQAPKWAEQIGAEGVEALSLSGRGSIANWFASFLFILTALASLQIYALRQHRSDDYRGAYRLWIWTAAVFALASMNCVVDVSSIALNLVRSLTDGSLVLRAWVPVAIQIVALSALVVRGLFEIHQSRGSVGIVLFVWLAYASAIALQLPQAEAVVAELGDQRVAGNCWLLGTAGLFLGHLTFARFVFLHANGLITVKAAENSGERSVSPKAQLAQAKSLQRAETKRLAAEEKQLQREAARQAKLDVKAGAAAKKLAAKEAKAANKRQRKSSASDELGSDVDVSEADNDSPVKAKTPPVKSAAKKTRTKKTTGNKSTARANEESAESAAPAKSAVKSTSKSSSQSGKSPSEVLRELAAASRAKASAASSSGSDEVDTEEEGDILNMSKAQRRKQRKLEKQRRRAA